MDERKYERYLFLASGQQVTFLMTSNEVLTREIDLVNHYGLDIDEAVERHQERGYDSWSSESLFLTPELTGDAYRVFSRNYDFIDIEEHIG